MKSQLDIMEALLRDASELYSVSLTKELMVIRERAAREGQRFLDTTLPAFSKHLIQCVKEGRITPLEGWSWRGSHPLFLGSLTRLIFGEDGLELSSPTTEALYVLRQICEPFSKVFAVCDDAYVEAAITGFLETEREIIKSPPTCLASLVRVFDHAYGNALAFEPYSDPKHGPGAVADGSGAIERWTFRNLPEGFEWIYPIESFMPSYAAIRDSYPGVYHEFSRLTAVPKTATGPRLIGIEPNGHMFMQQGLEASLYNILRRYRAVNLDSQVPNQELARKGSIDGSLATIDLSEASDRLSNSLVECLFARSKYGPALQIARSKGIQHDSFGLLPLRKFAPMGSATTFPVQVMVFSTIATLGILESRDLKITRGNVVNVLRGGELRVYGDDIIVPTDAADRVMELLTECGLKVNTSKSFSYGGFRESCGADWYRGTAVRPVFLRKLPARGTSASDLQLLAFSSQLTERYLFPHTAALVRGLVRVRVSEHDCALGCVPGTWHGTEDTLHRYNRGLQRHEFRTLLGEPKRVRAHGSDDARLAYGLARVGSLDPGYDPMQYEPRPRQVVPKSRWTAR